MSLLHERDALEEKDDDIEMPVKKRKFGFMSAMEGAVGLAGDIEKEGLMDLERPPDLWLDEVNNVLNPRSEAIRKWAIFILILIMLTGIITPFDIAFFEPEFGGIFIFNRIVDFIFILDIIINFHLSFTDSKSGLPVVSRTLIRKEYMRVWFWVDLLGVIPFDLFSILGLDSALTLQARQLVRLLRLAKLLRLFRANRIIATFETEYSINYDLISLTKFALIVVFIVHMQACGLFIVSAVEAADVNWEVVNGVDDTVATHSRYIMAIYWSTMTVSTIGYGDVGMVTDVERVYASAAMIVGASVYAFVVGAVSTIIANLDKTESEYREVLTSLNDFMASIDLSQPLRVKIRQYFAQVKRFSSNNHSSQEKLMWKMSPLLRGLVSQHINRQWITKVHWLKDAEEEFISEISMVLKGEAFAPKELIIRSDDLCDRLFIIKKGIVMSKGSLYVKNKILGEEMILTCAYRRGYTARALQYVDTSFLLKSDLFSILERYPALHKRVRKAAIRMAFVWTIKKVINRIAKKGKFDATELAQGGWEEGDNKGAIRDEQELTYRTRFSKNNMMGPPGSSVVPVQAMGVGVGVSQDVEKLLREQRDVMDALRRDIGFLKRSVEEIQKTQEAEANSSFSRLLASTL
jgi:hypothetical protein